MLVSFWMSAHGGRGRGGAIVGAQRVCFAVRVTLLRQHDRWIHNCVERKADTTSILPLLPPFISSVPQGGHQQLPSSAGAAPPPTFNGGGGNPVAPSPASSTGRAPSVASSPVGSGGTLHGSGRRPLKDVIVMAPCGEKESLPTNADLPADLFTSCLTTPMRMALRWFVRQNKVCARFVDVHVCVCLCLWFCACFLRSSEHCR